MILLIDNYDSFSYNLYQLAGSLYPDIRVIRNDAYTLEEIPVPGFYPFLSQEGNTFNITNTAYTPVALESLGAKKLITGENIPADSVFQFLLTGLEGAPMPEGSANGQKT